MEGQPQVNSLSVKNPAVKRLMREASEMKEPTEEYHATPVDDNLFEWHFTIRGCPDTEFEGGIYHGKMEFPNNYPMQPPNIYLLTPSGRFEVNKKICLTISSYHPEAWLPSWCVRTALLALISFMPTNTMGTIGSLDCPKNYRIKMAKESRDWVCNKCGKMSDILLNGDGYVEKSNQPVGSNEANRAVESVETSVVESVETSAVESVEMSAIASVETYVVESVETSVVESVKMSHPFESSEILCESKPASVEESKKPEMDREETENSIPVQRKVVHLGDIQRKKLDEIRNRLSVKRKAQEEADEKERREEMRREIAGTSKERVNHRRNIYFESPDYSMVYVFVIWMVIGILLLRKLFG